MFNQEERRIALKAAYQAVIHADAEVELGKPWSASAVVDDARERFKAMLRADKKGA